MSTNLKALKQRLDRWATESGNPAPTEGDILYVFDDLTVGHLSLQGAPDGWVLTVDNATPGNLAWMPASSGGSNVIISGGGSLPSANFNNTTPAAPAGDLNVKWQESAGNVSAYVDVSVLEPLLSHANLSGVSRVWTASGHLGLAGRIAGFDGVGATTYYQIGVDIQAYNATLAAIAALATTGFLVRTGAGTVAARSITNSDGTVVITNGDGVAGNVVLSASSTTIQIGRMMALAHIQYGI